MISDPKFLMYCKMTSLGGSECGECPCSNPEQCEMTAHPDYDIARREALARLWQYFSDLRSAREGLHPAIEEALKTVVVEKPSN